MTFQLLMRYVRELEEIAVQLSWVGKELASDQEIIAKQCHRRRAKIVSKLKEKLNGSSDRNDRR